MFDANARHLKQGTLFFAIKGNDLLYCKMLDKDHKNPRIKIITSYENNKGYKGHIYQGGSIGNVGRNWGFAHYSGHVIDGQLSGFVDEVEATKAKIILERVL